MKKLRRFNTENEYNNIELYHPTVSYVKETTDVHFQEQYWIDAVYLYQGTQTYGITQAPLLNYVSNDVDMFKSITLDGVEIYNDKMNVSFNKEITVSKESDDWIFYDSDGNETTKENATLFAPKNSLINSNKVKFENESDVKSIIVLLENGGMFNTFRITMDTAKEFGFTKNENDEWIIYSEYNVQIIGLNIEVENYSGYGLIPIEFFENISPTTLYYVDKSILSLQEKEEPQHARFLLKDGVKKISDGMFSRIPMIAVFIPSVIEEIGNMSFYESRGLSNITFRGQNNVKYIGESAFSKTNVTEFDFTDKITYIGEDAFSSSNLTNVYISRNIEKIGDYAFYSCSITEVFIPNNVKYIGESAFGSFMTPYYETLTSVTFEENSQVEYIGRNFVSCSKIKNFTLPKTVTYFGGFSGYKTELETLSVEEGNTAYDSRNNCNCIIETATNKLICGCKNMVLPDTIEIIGIGSVDDINITELILPNSVRIIEGFNSSYIKKLHIPASVTSINNLNGSTLTSLTIDSGNLVYNDGNGSNCIIETATNKLLDACKSTVIPSGVEIISPYCFNMVSISSITIPNTVTRIEDNGFYVSNSKTITFEENSNLTYIGKYSFQHSSITSFTIPNTVTTIEDGAFYYCNKLTSITIPSLITELKESTFGMCSKLSTITCLATTAPTFANNTFSNLPSSGTLNVPIGASGYDAWLSVLGEGWSIVEITE